MKNNWFLLSCLGGLLSACGMIVARNLPKTTSTFQFVGIIGAVWLMLSAAYVGSTGEPIKLGSRVILLMVCAAIFFWSDNLCRFGAFKTAPSLGVVLMTIEVAMIATVLLYDFIFVLKGKKMNAYEVGGFVLGVGSLILFRLAPQRNIQ
jgi:drug/metabolite transporter (DMT)-like permease